jgi:6,7-dimethyl-8-ribityllumazine synthase
MVEKIAKDIGLFNKILLIANSQRYGQGVHTNDLKQAKERSGGKHGNKGTEAAAALVKMLNFDF